MRFALLVCVLVLAGLLGGCPTPGPVVPGPDADAAVVVLDDGGVLFADAPAPVDAAPTPPLDAGPLDDCGQAQLVLEKLGCKDDRGQPLSVNKHGISFAATCREAKSKNVDIRPSCIKVATTCAGVFQCRL